MSNLIGKLKSVFFVSSFLLALTASLMNTSLAMELQREARFTGDSEWDHYGASVAVNGSLMVVGAPQALSSGIPGEVYVNEYDGNQWIQSAKLFNPTGNPGFGESVSVYGNKIAVGAPRNYARRGAVYVYEFQDSTWSAPLELIGDLDTEVFGITLDLSEDTLVVGSVGADEEDSSGAAYVYRYIDGSWIGPTKLVSGTPDDRFGWSVSIDDNKLAVGAPWENSIGAVYIYEFDGGAWSEPIKLTGESTADIFGHHLNLDGDTMLIASFEDELGDTVNVYEFDGSGWGEPLKLNGDTPGGYFGHALAVSGEFALVGAKDDPKSFIGSVYIFMREGLSWNRLIKFTEDEIEEYDNFGAAVAIEGKTLVVGAEWFSDQILEKVGSAYIYVLHSVPTLRCEGFAPPMDTNEPLRARRNKVIPLRAELFYEDEEVTGDDLAGVEPLYDISPKSSEAEEPVEASDDLLPLSAADEGDQFYFIETDEGYWQLILDVSEHNTPDVVYEIKMIAHPDGGYEISPTCTAEFKYVSY